MAGLPSRRLTEDEFLRGSGDYLREARESKEPLMVTSPSGGAVVLQAAETYRGTQELLEELDVTLAIHEGLRDEESAATHPARPALSKLRTKLGL